jgi:hypothetical protein
VHLEQLAQRPDLGGPDRTREQAMAPPVGGDPAHPRGHLELLEVLRQPFVEPGGDSRHGMHQHRVAALVQRGAVRLALAASRHDRLAALVIVEAGGAAHRAGALVVGAAAAVDCEVDAEAGRYADPQLRAVQLDHALHTRTNRAPLVARQLVATRLEVDAPAGRIDAEHHLDAVFARSLLRPRSDPVGPGLGAAQHLDLLGNGRRHEYEQRGDRSELPRQRHTGGSTPERRG